MVITDPKGEIFEKNGEMLKDLGYDVIVVNFRDPQMVVVGILIHYHISIIKKVIKIKQMNF